MQAAGSARRRATRCCASRARSATGRTTWRRACIARSRAPSASSPTTVSAGSPFRSSRRWRSGWPTPASRSSCATPPTIRSASASISTSCSGKRIDGLVVTARRADKRPPIGPLAHGLPVIYVFSQADDPGRALAAARRRGRRGAGRRASGVARPQAHRPCHGAGALRGRAAAAQRAIAPRWPKPGCPRSTASISPASGRRRGGARRSRSCFPIPQRPDAIFCGNDQIARGATDALREMGHRRARRRRHRRLRQLGRDGAGGAAAS